MSPDAAAHPLARVGGRRRGGREAGARRPDGPNEPPVVNGSGWTVQWIGMEWISGPLSFS